MKKNPDRINTINSKGKTALHLAVEDNDVYSVTKLLAVPGVDVNIEDWRGHYRPLNRAAKLGRIDCIKKLLAAPGVEINAKNSSHQTALHLAAVNGNVEIVKALLDNGVDVNTKDEDGNTALRVAVCNFIRHYDDKKATEKIILIYNLVKELLNAPGIDVNIKEDKTVLHLAAENGNVEIVKALLNAPGIDVNIKGLLGRTALSDAAYRGKTDIVQLLIDNKADVNIKDLWGKTALMYAKEKGYTEIEKLLEEAALKSQSADSTSETLAALKAGGGDVELSEASTKAIGESIEKMGISTEHSSDEA